MTEATTCGIRTDRTEATLDFRVSGTGAKFRMCVETSPLCPSRTIVTISGKRQLMGAAELRFYQYPKAAWNNAIAWIKLGFSSLATSLAKLNQNMKSMTRPRIGAVSYLNTKPLVCGLESLAKECEVLYDLPSRLADQLAAGELDAALIPSIEAASNPDYTIVSDACIGCCGPVWSVKLLSHVQPGKIETLALDEGSRTSAALTKIILAEKYNTHPKFQQLAIDEDWQAVTTDAVLVIGDRAMSAEHEPFEFSWDLGEAWHEWTGRPFVFAMWTASSDHYLDKLAWLLTQSRDEGLKQINAIADNNAAQYNLTIEQSRKYLGQHLQFALGAEEKAALEHYFQLAAKHQLIPTNTKLNFHECQATQ